MTMTRETALLTHNARQVGTLSGGHKMRTKRILTLILAVLMLAVGSACIFSRLGTPRPYSGDQFALYTQAAYSIPDAEQMGTQISVVEQDQEGRTLFEISFGRKAFYYKDYGNKDTRLYAYAVCQQYDDQFVYYYDDVCFAVFQDEADFTPENQERLKGINDWNTPLDYSRMIKKEILPEESEGRKLPYLSIGYDRAQEIRDSRAIEAFKKTISVADNEQVYTDVLDIDSQNQLLITVTVLQRKSFDKIDIESIHSYFMIYDTNNASQTAPIIEVENAKSYADQLSAFKSQYGWNPTR